MSKEEVVTPTWLNKEFIQTSMRKALNNETLTITSCEIKPALGPGENYASVIFRIKITVKNDAKYEDMSLILKSLPTGEYMQETINSLQMFKKEARILSELIPNMPKVLRTNKSKFSPKCYYHQTSPNELLIMEDMCVDGYRLGDRLNSLDLDHALLVVKNLATYHAGMRVNLKQNPELRHDFISTFWDESQNGRTAKMFVSTLEVLTDVADTWEGFPKSVVEKLSKLVTKCQKRENETWVVDDNFKLNTILHGDCWVNNMMFKYDSTGKVVEHIFLDYQIASYHSPLLDLVYFIFSSVKQEVRAGHLETIKRAYYDKLMSLLKQTEPELEFTYEEFEEEYKNRLFHGFVSAIIVFPVTSAPPKDAIDADEIFNQDSDYKMDHLITNERCQKIFKELLPYFDKYGVLDELQ